MLSGDNGIIKKATDAKIKTDIAQVIENAQTDILEEIAKNKGQNITKEQLVKILNKYFKHIEETSIPDEISTTKDLELTTIDEKYKINLSQIFLGKFFIQSDSNKQLISKQNSYVGYYADFEADGTVDGIIYADLSVGKTNSSEYWGNSGGKYIITPINEGLKDYYISQKEYNGEYGKKDVLSPIGTGNERFYVMDLKDIDGQVGKTYYSWYYAANDRKNEWESCTSKDIDIGNNGEGKAKILGMENTTIMLTKWNGENFGIKNAGTYKDVWGAIKTKVDDGWFLPSKSEISAFAGELGITKDNYTDLGLGYKYWSSSQGSRYYASSAYFGGYGRIMDDTVDQGYYIRLSTIF